MTMGGSTSKNDVEKAKYERDVKLLSVAAQRDTKLAQVKFNEKKMECEFGLSRQQLENERVKSKLHVSTQAEIIKSVLEKGYNPEEFCMITAQAFLTLKDECAEEERALLRTMMMHRMERKSPSPGKNGSTLSIDTGCEIDCNSLENQITV